MARSIKMVLIKEIIRNYEGGITSARVLGRISNISKYSKKCF